MRLQDAATQRGQQTRRWARETIQRLKGIASGKRGNHSPLIVTTRELQSEALMCELSPPLLRPEERGQGDSTNARLHRAIYGAKR